MRSSFVNHRATKDERPAIRIVGVVGWLGTRYFWAEKRKQAPTPRESRRLRESPTSTGIIIWKSLWPLVATRLSIARMYIEMFLDRRTQFVYLHFVLCIWLYGAE